MLCENIVNGFVIPLDLYRPTAKTIDQDDERTVNRPKRNNQQELDMFGL